MSAGTQDGGPSPVETVTAEVREGHYKDETFAIEPGGAELIPESDRHGVPLGQFWTWSSPNMEFATVFVGVIAVAFFGLSFWWASVAIIVGSALGSLSQGLLASRGPLLGVPQMIASRIPFGKWGNVLPSGLNTLTAGIGWFAVNSVSGAYALNTLTKISLTLSLLIVVLAQLIIAFFGYNLVHFFHRLLFPFLVLAFVLGAFYVFPKTQFHVGGFSLSGFLLSLGASFGYAAGWNPYAMDYSRYLPKATPPKAVGLAAGLGVFWSMTFLEILGAASATATGSAAGGANPTGAFTGQMGTTVGDIVLVAIVLGGISANVLNVYSGAMSLLVTGINLPLAQRRAIAAVFCAVVGFFVAKSALPDAGAKYNNFLLVIAYWIGPWLGVYFADQFHLRKGKRVDGFMFDRKHNPWAGWLAMLIAMAVSIFLFSNQTEYVGVLPKHFSQLGDITFEVGFVLAWLLYWLFFKLEGAKAGTEEILVLPDAA